MKFVLPYPPTLNLYLRHITVAGRARTLLSAEAKAYQREVQVRAMVARVRPMQERLAVTLRLAPPTHNKAGARYSARMDLDNAAKVAIDALKGLAFGDDSQIDRLVIERAPACPGGALHVEIEPERAAA